MAEIQLNSQQLEAVKYISGPCLVIAGAGSGKTKVITEKISYLLNKCDFRGSEICALTFTNKAAREMKSRISKLIEPDVLKGILITTFHSLGLYIIKREYEHLNLKKNFILLDSLDQRKQVISIYQELANTDEAVDDEIINNIVNEISRAKMKGWSPDDYLAQAVGEEKIVAFVYDKYQRKLDSCSALDFDDLILKPMKLLSNNEALRRKWQRRIRYLLVDEYQDTNEIQYELLKVLIGPRCKFTFVGDDDQSIYAWRGANPDNLKQLYIDFPDLKVIKLEQNYRSCGVILHVANELISHNKHLFDKKLFSAYSYGDPIIIHETDNPLKEAEYITAEIIAQRFMNSYKWKNFAVLYRTNFQSREIEKSFRENHIPYRISGDISFFEKAEVKDIMAYYRVLVNPQDDNALMRIINVPRREIGETTTEKLGLYARNKEISLFDAMKDDDFLFQLSDRNEEAVTNFRQFIEEKTDELEYGDQNKVILNLFDDIGYKDYLLQTNKTEQIANIKYENIQQLQTWILKKLKGDPKEGIEPSTFQEAVHSINLREMLDKTDEESDDDVDQVQLMTMHSSKGLEFNFVFIPGFEEEIIPHINSIESNTIEEERRLLYVGITRARRNLVLSYCKHRKQGESTDISRFFNELPEKDLKIENFAQQKEINMEKNMALISDIISKL